jgi:hypothetical protein
MQALHYEKFVHNLWVPKRNLAILTEVKIIVMFYPASYIGFAKMPEFFMPAPTAPIPATAGTAGSAGTKKRFFFGSEKHPCNRHFYKYFEVNHYISIPGLFSLTFCLFYSNICNDFFDLLWKFEYSPSSIITRRAGSPGTRSTFTTWPKK